MHPGTTHTEAAKRGVISLDAETEGGLGMPAREEHIQLWEKTILNIMKRLGMIPGEPEFPEHVYVETEREATIGSGFTTIDPVKHGGFMTPLVKLMDRVSKGQRLASITNLYGDEVDAIYAPCDDGIVLSIGANVVQPGGTPIAVGHIIPRGDLD